MLIENEFTVATPVDDLWAYLLDVERIAPCMPGAELTETVDDRHWKGKVNVKFGPVALSFAGTVEMTERDDEAHRAVLRAKGMEQKGKGAANATVTSWLEPAADGETTVKMTADIALTGAAAQLSRGAAARDLEEAHPAVRRLPRGARAGGEPPRWRPTWRGCGGGGRHSHSRPAPLPRPSLRSTSAASVSASPRSGRSSRTSSAGSSGAGSPAA